MTTIITYTYKHTKKIIFLSGIFLIGILGLVTWKYYQARQNDSAQSEMFQAVYHFEEGEYGKALQGDNIHSGFLDILQKYKFTKAANLAHFYSSICYMHQENYQSALHHLRNFTSNDLLLQARAWSLMGDAFVEQKSYPEAIKYYFKAANYKPNEIFSPIYLVKAAITYEAQQDYKNALKCYQEIVDKYTKSTQYESALKHVDRLEGLLS